MHLSKKIFGLLILGTILLCGCSTSGYAQLNNERTGSLENQIQDDVRLAKKIENQIKHVYPKKSAILVVSERYNILLLGEVDSQATKDGINQIVSRQLMVKKTWDYTKISNTPKLKDTSSLTDDARERINKEPNINLDHLQVVSVDNIIYIMGNIRVNEEVNLRQAIDGISSLDGVNSVINLVQTLPALVTNQ